MADTKKKPRKKPQLTKTTFASPGNDNSGIPAWIASLLELVEEEKAKLREEEEGE